MKNAYPQDVILRKPLLLLAYLGSSWLLPSRTSAAMLR